MFCSDVAARREISHISIEDTKTQAMHSPTHARPFTRDNSRLSIDDEGPFKRESSTFATNAAMKTALPDANDVERGRRVSKGSRSAQFPTGTGVNTTSGLTAADASGSPASSPKVRPRTLFSPTDTSHDQVVPPPDTPGPALTTDNDTTPIHSSPGRTSVADDLSPDSRQPGATDHNETPSRHISERDFKEEDLSDLEIVEDKGQSEQPRESE